MSPDRNDIVIKPLKIIQREPKFCHRDEVKPRGSITKNDIEIVQDYLKRQKKITDEKRNEEIQESFWNESADENSKAP